jgi:hypothetical protein
VNVVGDKLFIDNYFLRTQLFYNVHAGHKRRDIPSNF